VGAGGAYRCRYPRWLACPACLWDERETHRQALPNGGAPLCIMLERLRSPFCVNAEARRMAI
jgi:hypothetical protein